MIVIAAEKVFENKIKKYLKEHKCWYVKFFANAYTKEGVPDVLAGVNGYFLAIEVKAPNGKPSELQKYNIRLINSAGAYAVVVRPTQWLDFQSLVNALEHKHEFTARELVDKINSVWEI